MFDDALKYLNGLTVFGIKPGLARIEKILSALGNPEKNYATVHVTGTNGKGSVCAMLAEILKADGRRVGLFTSPHLESYCERIRIDGENISEEEFAAQIELVKNCGVAASHFEVLTAAAYEYFSRRKVDMAVIEVGIGGLWDSTNVITPLVSVITNVALEHEQTLGGDLKNIALNKAGIIKAGVPCVTGAAGEALEVIRAVAREKNSRLYEVREPVDVKINLRGEYQKFNAAVAIQAARVLEIADEKIFAALERVTWAGRFENIGGVILDGAHNPHGAAALRESLDEIYPSGRRVWIFGVLADKNFDAMIDILFRAGDFVIVTPPESERAASTEIICERLSSRGIENIGVEKISDAVALLKKSADDVKIVAGSLYLIGAARKYFEV
ncbi:MAG: bifunctional folylpolyglutamate synthase/dihydrofolate synthase [Selenomonadaceae bacterium]|nr:bifunctional folylpolyglutamate synthase/dihydrofolate synthase [Selenomonadaceae bacterium]